MKNPLHDQLSEYDCGPTSMLNAMSYRFQREDLPPEIIRNIMLDCLDCYGAAARWWYGQTLRDGTMYCSPEYRMTRCSCLIHITGTPLLSGKISRW